MFQRGFQAQLIGESAGESERIAVEQLLPQQQDMHAQFSVEDHHDFHRPPTQSPPNSVCILTPDIPLPHLQSVEHGSYA